MKVAGDDAQNEKSVTHQMLLHVSHDTIQYYKMQNYCDDTRVW